MSIKNLLPVLIFFAFAQWSCTSSEPSSTTTQTATTAYQDLDVPTFKSKMGDDNIIILDVRTPEEIANGKIEGALEMDFRNNEFQKNFHSLDKDKTYLVYCRSGGRSAKACKMMQDEGFTKVNNLLGGWNAWSE